MNLLELLQQEVKDLRYSDPLVIARYIYIRIGELFEYDPFYNIANEEDSKKIREQKIDIRNVTSFHLICYSFAKMYHELLGEFGIQSKIIHDFCHDYVEVLVHDKKFVADMTKDYQDISFIKYGMTEHSNFYSSILIKNKRN